MTTQPVEAAGDAADVSPSHVAHKVEDGAAAHVPEAVTPPTPPHTVTDPSTAGKDRLDSLETVVTGLANSVAALTDLVTTSVGKDASPHKGTPWTHRGGRRNNE